MVIIGILYGTFHIHKCKRCNSKPCFNAFMADFLMLNDSVKCPDNKESKYKMMLAEKLKLLANVSPGPVPKCLGPPREELWAWCQ